MGLAMLKDSDIGTELNTDAFRFILTILFRSSLLREQGGQMAVRGLATALIM